MRQCEVKRCFIKLIWNVISSHHFNAFLLSDEYFISERDNVAFMKEILECFKMHFLMQRILEFLIVFMYKFAFSKRY